MTTIEISYVPFVDGSFEFYLKEADTGKEAILKGQTKDVYENNKDFLYQVAPLCVYTKYVTHTRSDTENILLEALEDIVKCEINRMTDLKSLSQKPKSLYTFSKTRVEKAQKAINIAKGLY